MQHPAWHHPSRLILGGGTNLLLTHDVPGMVLQPNMKGMRILHRSQHHSLVSFKAAERWDDCVRFCLAHKLYGLENLSGIPGCIGAAAVQNIGAYGVELNSVFAYLDAFDLTTGYEKRFDLQACAFAYRDSFFKRTAPGRYLIHTVTLQCQHTPITQIHYPALKTQLDASACIKPTPYDVRQAVLQCRASK